MIVLYQYEAMLNGTGSEWGSTGWYLVVLGQYNFVLLGFKWNWASQGLYACLYFKKVEIWSDVTIAGRTNDRTNERTRKDRATQPMDHGRLR